MERSSPIRAAAGLLVWAALCSPATIAAQAQGTPSVRRVQVLGNRTPVEIEIEASDRLVPQTQLLTGPDRLVVDFPNAVPGLQLRNQKVSHGEIKGVRVSLFSAKPPVTRVVIDLKEPQNYQVFPYGRTVMVKVGVGPVAAKLAPASASGIASRPGLVNTSYPAQSAAISVSVSAPTQAPPPPPLVVSFQAGLLTISSNKASLSEILFAVHQRTGAEIAIPAGAEQEQVVADLGPATAPEVLAHLLNGTKFNFLILSSATDPSLLDRVILSERPEGAMAASRPLAQIQTQEDVDDAGRGAPPPPVDPGNQPQPNPPDTKPPSGNDTPD
ncbi:MAG: AMIN domain-containing protein [Candidatus Sulfotelmatobacter sp.]